ncbi:hypothetical protein [Roseovarius sp.]|uniref:hypothetical protein n=1 Tax=Roseovarius sp. TaxID=1486281 RepID=UPI00261A5F8F|nr:hypothetical protein [Roseovarius sp.]
MARVDPEKIEAAQAFAENEVREFLATEPSRDEGNRASVGVYGPVATYLRWKLNLSFADGKKGPYMNVPLGADRDLCALALTNADVRKLVLDIIAFRILNGQTLTSVLKQFACWALLGQLPKPIAKPGTKTSKNFERDMFIIWTLDEIKKSFGVPPTENDMRSRVLSPSGMGILAKCFADAGRHEVTAKAIKDVWLNKKKRRECQRLSEAIANHKEPSMNAFANLLSHVGS